MMRQSGLRYTSKMYFPLIVILSLAVSVPEISGQANVYEYPVQSPWTVIYAVYPFYNSETIIEAWKDDKAGDISTNMATSGPNDQEKTWNSENVTKHNETEMITQNGVQYFSNAAGNTHEDQLPKNRQRLSNYRNRHHDSSSQN